MINEGSNATDEIWQKVEVIGSKKNTYTMHVDYATKAPKRYVMMGYDTLFGSHYDKYYVTYSTYENESAIPAEKFNITNG